MAADGGAFLPLQERFLGLDDDRANPETAGVVILPVPFEATSSYGHGSANGPAAILEASRQVEFFDTALGFEPCGRCGGIVTRAPLALSDSDDGSSVMEKLDEAVTQQLDGGKMVVTVGGEHTSIVGAVRAYARKHPNMTVLQLDAHSDMRAEYEGTPWSHACAMARICDFHSNLVQAGIRSEEEGERATVEDMDIPVFRGEQLQRDDLAGVDWVSAVINACAADVYVTFDLDVLDPGLMPATGTPEPGGMTWLQVDRLFSELCKHRNVAGFDVSELAPIPTVHHPQFVAAKLIYRFIGHLFK